MTTERDRMLSGEAYNSRDPALLAIAHRARALLREFSGTPSTDADGRQRILGELLGGLGSGVWIEPPFFCDYGENIFIGEDSFINVNCVFLDSAEIRVGANGLIGPGVQLLTPTHPLRAADRIVSTGDRRPDQSPYRTSASPIRIGDNVWIGGGTLVLPGVTIGDNVSIGAGSIVTTDIASDSLALGQPCRVIRALK
jgi:maltose O-acetyltransferase